MWQTLSTSTATSIISIEVEISIVTTTTTTTTTNNNNNYYTTSRQTATRYTETGPTGRIQTQKQMVDQTIQTSTATGWMGVATTNQRQMKDPTECIIHIISLLL